MTRTPGDFGTISPARLGEIAMGKEIGPDGRPRNRYRRTPFVNLLNRAVMDLLAGDSDCLGVSGPPRHGKTQILNILTAAHFLGTNPRKQVIAISHSAKLAERFGLTVRDILVEFGPTIYGCQVRRDAFATDNWRLDEGGGMLSIGVGGSLVGFGADLLILDDIIADSKAALSEVVRNATMDYYESTAVTRLNSRGKQIVTMQRWHDDDPYARIVKANPAFRDITIRAIAEADDPLGRQPGEALWPEEYPIAKLREIERLRSFWFAAQYQQRPVPRGGGMIPEESIRQNAVGYVPREVDGRVRWWDRAATQGDGDYTVGLLMSRKGDHYYIEDVFREQLGSTPRDLQIRATCDADNRRYPHNVVTWAEQEPGSAGKDSAAAFEKMLRPHAAHCETSSGSKEVRADSLASAFGAGDVHVCGRHGPEGVILPPWYDEFAAELSVFPFGKHDDAVDACSGAFNKLALVATPGGYATVGQDEYAEYELAEGGYR